MIHATITGLIRDELLSPEHAVAGRGGAMAWTAVPEAAIHKECEPQLSENEIRLAEDLLIPSPAGDVVKAQEFHQGKLGVLVAAPADGRHHLGSFGFGENIRHEIDLLASIAELPLLARLR